MDHGLLRSRAVLDQARAKLLDMLWRHTRPGAKVRCLDDHNGGNFLVAGQVYVVDQMQLDSANNWRVCLVGMACAWEVDRFERVV